jgi:2-polyprenyl-3-methyl-5-hydroxy-6-metoxy-1,4-benzoquinol methylase
MTADYWNQRYSESGFAYGTEPNEFLKSVHASIPKGKLLSLAEGEGRNAVFLATLGCNVTAVDCSAVGMQKAKQLALSHGVDLKTIVSDLNDFDIEPDYWEGIISIFCHQPKPLRKKLHHAVVRGLKPNGVFILEAYSPKQLQFNTGGPKDENLLMTLNDVKNELSGLSFEIAKETERDVREGMYHNGKSSVIQIVAKKI